MNENCKSLILQDKCNIEIFLSPAMSWTNSGNPWGDIEQILETHDEMTFKSSCSLLIFFSTNYLFSFRLGKQKWWSKRKVFLNYGSEGLPNLFFPWYKLACNCISTPSMFLYVPCSPIIFVCLFVWFDSLCPINNLSVKQGRVFLGWNSTKLE